MTNQDAKDQLRIDWSACAVGNLQGRVIDWTHHDKEVDSIAARTDADTAYAQISKRFKVIAAVVNRGAMP